MQSVLIQICFLTTFVANTMISMIQGSFLLYTEPQICTTAWGVAVSTEHPQLRQGRKCLLFIISYCFGTLLGANELESVQNLYDWLDSILLKILQTMLWSIGVMEWGCGGGTGEFWGKHIQKSSLNFQWLYKGVREGCFAQRRNCGTMFQLAGAGEEILTIESMSNGTIFLNYIASYYVNNVQTIIYTYIYMHLLLTLHTLYIHYVQTFI